MHYDQGDCFAHALHGLTASVDSTTLADVSAIDQSHLAHTCKDNTTWQHLIGSRSTLRVQDVMDVSPCPPCPLSFHPTEDYRIGNWSATPTLSKLLKHLISDLHDVLLVKLCCTVARY